MGLSIEKKHDCAIAYVKEKNLTGDYALLFQDELLSKLDSTPKNQWIIDLSAIQEIDASGMACFLHFLRFLNQKGGGMKLAHLSEPVSNYFSTSGLNDLFEVLPSIEEAELAFSKEQQ